MNRTKEQQKIVESALRGESSVINACAGSGKSTTLREIIKEINANLPDKSIVVCIYNKTAQTDFEKKLPKGTRADIKTMHALAHDHTIKKDRLLEAKLKLGNVTAGKIIEAANIDMYPLPKQYAAAFSMYGSTPAGFTDYFIARLAYKAVLRFINTPDMELTKEHVDFCVQIGIKTEKTFYEGEFRPHLLGLAKKIWKIMSDAESVFPITHDSYVKLWQLTDPVIDYDVVLVDEAQDTNPVMQYIFSLYAENRENGQIIYVGDEKQSIYGFRGAVNAMALAKENTKEVRSHYLTQSFRYGRRTACLANTILSVSRRPPPEIRGFDGIDTKIGGMPPHCGKIAVLCRTNAGAIEECLRYTADGKKTCINGSAEKTADLLRSVNALSKGDRKNVKHPQVMRYATWDEYTETAELTDDHDMKRFIMMVTNPELDADRIADMLTQAGRIKPKDAEVFVSTAHKAKGMEWDNVVMSGDFSPPIRLDPEKKTPIIIEQELNLIYVALTRAVNRIAINEAVEKLVMFAREHGRVFEYAAPVLAVKYTESEHGQLAFRFDKAA